MWNHLTTEEQRILMPKLIDPVAGLIPEAAGRRFEEILSDPGSEAQVDHLLTARNFILQAGGHRNSEIWRQIYQIKGFRKSYIELTVRNRHEFLATLDRLGYIINREPFWTIHKFDSARAVTEYYHEPSLHFANDRADEDGYGPEYFFVHWDPTSVWFRRSQRSGWRQIERLRAALVHRKGFACPRAVNDFLRRAPAGSLDKG